MREEVVAQRMMQAALSAMVTAMGADGAAVIDPGHGQPVMHRIGTPTQAVLDTALALLATPGSGPAEAVAGDGRDVLACPSRRDGLHHVALVLWRPPDSRGWDADDLVLATSASGIIRVVLAHEEMQREMLRQARTDPLTGLLNRRAFMEELDRRIERLDREGLPGTLMFVDIDNFKDLNDARGHDAGDEALMLTGELLRATVRPSDLVARLGGDEFVLWLDGVDDLTAAERAESLRLCAPRALADITEGYCPRLTLSIGIATRWPGDADPLEALLNRADQAMYQVKRNGRGHWRVAHPVRPA
jgi:diguanylate cyclase (GGDEF)-like protein